MTGNQRAALLAEVVKFTRPPVLESDEITRTDYREETGLGDSAATNALENLVGEGVLTKRQVFDPRTHRKVWAYRRASEGGQ